ncbi:MAG: hypothetical protein CFH05_01015, partial [Alphaproteobacteria bacterium MarineAlpha3_Bin4]
QDMVQTKLDSALQVSFQQNQKYE